MTMTLTSAKKLFADIVNGKVENTKKNFDTIAKFASESKKPLTDLLSKANLQKAIELGIILPPNSTGKKAAEQKPSNKKQAEQPKEDNAKKQADAMTAKKKEREELVAKSKAHFARLQEVVKANTVKRPEVLFRLAWKEKRQVMGMDVIHIHPIARGNVNLIGIMLDYDADSKSFTKQDIIGSIDLNQLEFDGIKPVVFDDAGTCKELHIQFPKAKEEPAKAEDKPKRTLSRKVKEEEGK